MQHWTKTQWTEAIRLAGSPGRALAVYREAFNLSQLSLSAALKCGQQYVSFLERNPSAQPSLRFRLRAQQAIGLGDEFWLDCRAESRTGEES